MNGIDLKQRTIGFHRTEEGKGRLAVWAPLAEKIEAVFTRSSERLPLQKEEGGYWTLTSDRLTEGTRYKLSVDGGDPFPDPASLSQPEGVHGPSEAIRPENFSWTDTDWKNLSLDEYIIYELHTGTFSASGTFAGLEEKLDCLKELGITAIEIMPVAQFPGSRNWGYDGVFPFAVQDSYGGAAGLQRLVDTCHKKGLAVILDVVYNHLGPEGNYLGAFGPYFTEKYNTPWGNALNFDDAWCDGVREYFIQNALMWFRDFHVDALRLDAVHAIKDFSPKHILREIRERVEELMEHTGRRHYLIVELDLNDYRFIQPLEAGGYGMDSQWIDEFHHALRVSAGGETTGYYSDFDGINHLAKAYRDAYVYDGQFSPHRKKKFGVPAATDEGKQFIVFSQNHDQVGNRMLGERTSVLASFELQKLMAGAVLVSPFLPMLFMGEEWSEPNPFQYFVSHTDPELADAVRKGRKAEFAAFHAEGEAPDPVSEETFLRSKLQWDLREQEPYATLLRYYQTLIALRKSVPALCRLNRKNVEVTEDDTARTLMLRRWHEDEQVICLMNFSEDEQTFVLPQTAPGWELLLDSAHPQWKGNAPAQERAAGGATVLLQPQSLILYTNNHVSTYSNLSHTVS